MASVPVVVEELKEVDGRSVEHLPEDDDSNDAKDPRWNEVERHAESKECRWKNCREAVAHVDVVAKRSTIGVSGIEQRVRRPNSSPLAKRKDAQDWNRTREHLSHGGHLTATIGLADCIVLRLNLILLDEERDLPPSDHDIDDEKERQPNLRDVVEAVRSLMQPDVKPGAGDDDDANDECSGDCEASRLLAGFHRLSP